jgi:hypothetical protein
MAWFVLLLATTANVDVELWLSDGTVQSGQLEQLTVDKLAIRQQGESHEFAVGQLRQVRFPNSNPADQTAHEAVLSDGSHLMLGTLRVTGNDAILGWATGGGELTIPRRALQSVRLMNLPDEMLKAWEKIAQTAHTADVVVIRQQNRLQQVDGVIGDIDDATVRFQFDGNWIEVRREKIAGLLFVTPAGSRQGLPRGQLVTRDGSQIQLLKFERSDNQLALTTPNGTTLNISLDQIQQIDLAAISTVYLSDVDPETSDVIPYVRVPELAAVDKKWFAMQRDRRISREPLSMRINGRETVFTKGLGLHGRTELGYRLAGKYQRFLAQAAVDELGGSGAGHLTLVILADGAERYRQTMAAGDPASEINIDLSGVNRMQILVDYGDQNDLGDHLSLGDARFVK